MYTIQGRVEREVRTADYRTERRIESKSFTAIDKEGAFRSLAETQDYWYFSTNNGMVPRFLFDDSAVETEYKAWVKTKNSIDFHRGIVD